MGRLDFTLLAKQQLTGTSRDVGLLKHISIFVKGFGITTLAFFSNGFVGTARYGTFDIDPGTVQVRGQAGAAFRIPTQGTDFAIKLLTEFGALPGLSQEQAFQFGVFYVFSGLLIAFLGVMGAC